MLGRGEEPWAGVLVLALWLWVCTTVVAAGAALKGLLIGLATIVAPSANTTVERRENKRNRTLLKCHIRHTRDHRDPGIRYSRYNAPCKRITRARDVAYTSLWHRPSIFQVLALIPRKLLFSKARNSTRFICLQGTVEKVAKSINTDYNIIYRFFKKIDLFLLYVYGCFTWPLQYPMSWYGYYLFKNTLEKQIINISSTRTHSILWLFY